MESFRREIDEMWAAWQTLAGHDSSIEDDLAPAASHSLHAEQDDDAGPAWIRGELIAFNAEEHVRAAMTDKIILDTSFLSTMALSLSS